MKNLLTFKEFFNEATGDTNLYNEFLNEGAVSFEGMTFNVSVINNMQGLAIQFIPNSKTLDNFSKSQQADTILARLKKGMPELASTLSLNPGHTAAGLVFSIDSFALAEIITKAVK